MTLIHTVSPHTSDVRRPINVPGQLPRESRGRLARMFFLLLCLGVVGLFGCWVLVVGLCWGGVWWGWAVVRVESQMCNSREVRVLVVYEAACQGQKPTNLVGGLV